MMKTKLSTITLFLFSLSAFGAAAHGQSYIQDMARQSARSDIRAGEIKKAELIAGSTDLKVTVNVPEFDMTLWQNGQEIKRYPVGVGLKDYPIYIGLREIDMVIFNPSWIPPARDWVAPSLQGVVIGPKDPRNPLGKVKIPLGYGYLIHQAKGTQDLGNLVSHGCLRVMRNDLYDMNQKFLTALELDVSSEVAAAKRNKETFVIELSSTIPIEITYDTMVVENDILSIYPDVYEYDKDRTAKLRTELEANGIDTADIKDSVLTKMIAKAVKKQKYVISLDKIRAGSFLDGTVTSVVKKPAKKSTRRRRS